eukprot:SAG31_NODE_736_length_12477_cov_60.959363_2_plen_42_part_00
MQGISDAPAGISSLRFSDLKPPAESTDDQVWPLVGKSERTA